MRVVISGDDEISSPCGLLLSLRYRINSAITGIVTQSRSWCHLLHQSDVGATETAADSTDGRLVTRETWFDVYSVPDL